MIILRLDKNGGINKGDIKAFEHDNKSETYIIQLYKNNKVYDLTNKTVELTIVEKKRKYGDVVTLPVEAAAEGKVKLEIVAALTKQDGTYDFKLTVKDTAGLIETFPNFQVKIDTDITKNIAGEIAEDKNFTIITEGLKALGEYEVYKTNAKKVPDIEKNVANLGSQLETIATYVTPEMFGAVGDGITDDTKSFELAFKSGKNIICKKGKTYYFANIINARSVTNNVLFNGNYATFVNFNLEISLLDNSYDWRRAYSPNRIELCNCTFGIENDEKEQSYNKPVVTSGMTVIMNNIILAGRLVLVAYPNRYIDVLHLSNVIKMNNEHFTDDFNYNAVMRINTDGTLVKTTLNGAGDSWLFTGCNEFRSIYSNNDTRYGLVTLYNNTATFLECIQSNVELKTYVTATFIACHYEESYVNVLSEAANLLAKFDGCYFYGQTIPKAKKNIIFENCMFRLGYGSSFNYTGDNSILKNSQVINCRFSDNAGLIASSTDVNIDIGCNYKSDDFESYGNPPSIDIYSEPTKGSFIGETKITLVGKRLETTYCAFKTEKTLTLDGTNIIRIKIFNKPPMIYEIFIENNGKIYRTELRTIDSSDTIEIHLFNNFFRSSVTYRKEKNNKCYPPSDTLEVVSNIPTYTVNLNLYRLSKGLCVDTSDVPVTGIPRFATISKTVLGEGSMW